MYAANSSFSQPISGAASKSLHQSLNDFHNQAAHATAAGRASLPISLHDALYGPRAHSLGPHMIRSAAADDKDTMSKEGMNGASSSAGGTGMSMSDGSVLTSHSSMTTQNVPWQADLMADLISSHGSNTRVKPASAPLSSQENRAAAPSRPSAAYGTIVQERAGFAGQFHSALALMQQQTKHLAAAAAAAAASGCSASSTYNALPPGAQRSNSTTQPNGDAREVTRQQQGIAAASKHPAVFGSMGATANASAVPGPTGSALYQRLQPANSVAAQLASRHQASHGQPQHVANDQMVAKRAAAAHPNGTAQPAALMQLSPVGQQWPPGQQQQQQQQQQQYPAKSSQQTIPLNRVGSLSISRHGSSTPGGQACSSNDSTTAYLECDEDLMHTEETHSPGPPYRVRRVTLVESQSYVYQPISYPDHSSPDALAMANAIMLRLTIPGGITYKPIQYNSKLYHQGCRFGFTAFAICLGSSYFQRLLAGMPHLEYAVRRSGPSYTDYLECMAPCSERRWATLHSQYGSQYGSSTQVTEESTLASIQFACVYLATKMVDRMPMLEMLRYILTHLYGSVVSKAQAYDVESKCLEGLGFRLGPYFREDKLDDDWPY